jgi:hypothetical protein
MWSGRVPLGNPPARIFGRRGEGERPSQDIPKKRVILDLRRRSPVLRSLLIPGKR